MLGAIADDGCNGLLPPGFCQCRGFCPFGICALLSPRVLGPGSTPPRLSRKLRGDEGGGIDCRTRKCGWRKWSEQPGRVRANAARVLRSPATSQAPVQPPSPSHNNASERFLALHPIVSPAKTVTSQEHTASSPEFSPEHTFHGPTKERV